MTGPEHYEKAAAHLGAARELVAGDADTEAVTVTLLAGLLHGVLALTAATALQSYYAPDDTGSGLDADAWQETVGES